MIRTKITEKDFVVETIQPFIICTKEMKSQILHDYEFSERCARDGIITYSKECEEHKQIVKKLDNEIEELEHRIDKTEKELKNVSDGFKEMEYRWIDKAKQKLELLKKIREGTS